MKPRLRETSLARIGLLVLLAFFAGPCLGQIVLTPKNANGLYRAGEKVVWTITAGSEADKSKVAYAIRKNGTDEVIKQGVIDLSSGSAPIEASLIEPGALLLEVGAEKIRDGAIVDGGNLKPCLPRPADFEAWWAEKLAKLRAVPMNPQLEKTEVGVPGVEYSKVTLDCVEGTHVRGQLAKPAKPGKFPAILQFQYAGVYPLPHQWVTERAKAGWLAFNVPSHDQPIDDADEIKRLAEGPLKDYPALGNTDRETCYFLQMYLRDCRALEYLASRPDWDGKTLVVTGDSMGGQQAIATVGLMNGRLKISAMIVHVPSGGDVGARSKGRPMAYPGWWGPPEVMKTAPYFDPANFAPMIKAPSLVSLGLFDGIAPPTTILSVFNLLADPKELLPLHSDHGGPGQEARDVRREEWLTALVQGKPAPVNMRGESKPAPRPAAASPATRKAAPIRIPRGRPRLNAARTTFVADNGQLLRGPYESTEWTGAAPYENVARMKTLGFNAVHLYGEAFDPRFPDPGSTPPGTKVEEVDKFVKMTRELGLYLVLTIGNGAANGKYNKPWILGFWKFYAARYAKETHVLFEVQNEPVAWGPPYGNPNATPPGAIGMEIEAYQTIRAVAPESPVLLFSYSVLGGNGGKEALKDIETFNAGVGGDPRQIWSNAAIAFHGYAGHVDTPRAVADLLAAGYPCVMTEFISSDWGGTDGQDIELTAELERLGVSWLNFLTIPPHGVSPDVTIPEVFKKRIEFSGLSWTPDFGTWPVKRGVFGNGGQPRATQSSWEKDRLTGAFRLEFEDFDTGGQGVAYHDKSERANDGRVYRPDEGVDIRAISDGSAGFAVRADDGEWLEYTVQVKEPGFYQLSLRYACGVPGALRMLLGGKEFTRIPLANTGGPSSWKTLTQPVFLEYGRKILRVEIPKGVCDLNWLELAPVKEGPIPDGAYKILNRASGQAMTNLNNTIVQTPFENRNAQLWKFEHLGAGQYRISSLENKCYWATNLDSSIGLVWWGGENTGGHQRFVIRRDGDGTCRIAPVAGGHDLGVKDASTQGGAPIQRHPYKGESHQQWAIQKPDAISLPAGVVAERVSASQVNVTWEPVSGATGYVVKRATTSGGPYGSVRIPPGQKGYADRSAAKGKDYFYVVSAVGDGEESSNSAEVSPCALRAHLKIDETSGGTARDDTGSGWDGTLVGGPKRVPGRAGNALAFDGQDDHVTLPEGIVSGLGDFSISAWVNLDASKPWARIFDFGRGPGACMFLTPCGGASNSLRFAISAGSGEQVIEGSKPVPTGKWAHVAVVLKGGVGTLYLDAEEVGRNAPITLTPAALGETTRNFLGKSQFPDPHLAGKLDDFRIYAGALSPGEIAAQAKSPPAAP